MIDLFPWYGLPCSTETVSGIPWFGHFEHFLAIGALYYAGLGVGGKPPEGGNARQGLFDIIDSKKGRSTNRS